MAALTGQRPSARNGPTRRVHPTVFSATLARTELPPKEAVPNRQTANDRALLEKQDAQTRRSPVAPQFFLVFEYKPVTEATSLPFWTVAWGQA